ncbi:Uncharacterised protein [Salmonella enterica subsp. enterica serovar Typhi]|nr:Uncharacterised protein [Salmonella enterica subsp. enterica serovar Typhi]CHX94379.1 Uncharacterised protein [Salmonella enterica subsp. enterica serovar Typhi]CQW44057.1 Uncharacterised protein [Salmonella enterica subsp. enterica serovar Typhi]CRA98822.1 Uncharacterised protein [Salmonella enterica subsp. enterica serovar Typhi]CRB18321.1 Uncharacterised protein [Salmonella enterica subsp. enterica serovar Typhi]
MVLGIFAVPVCTVCPAGELIPFACKHAFPANGVKTTPEATDPSKQVNKTEKFLVIVCWA